MNIRTHDRIVRTTPNPSDIVAKQLDAYNAHDLEAFIACYAESIRIFHPPRGTPTIEGLGALAAFYRDHRFNDESLRADVESRLCIGSLVIDHERIQRSGADVTDAIAVFEVHGVKITNAWFFNPITTTPQAPVPNGSETRGK